jgi:hypothetical protein
MTEVASSVAAVAVRQALGAGWPPGVFSAATREQESVFTELSAIDLARQPGGALHLARARIAGLARRSVANSGFVAAVAVAAVRCAIAARHADMARALKLAAAVIVVRTSITDHAVAPGTTREGKHERADQ